jgi:hypothetical protein
MRVLVHLDGHRLTPTFSTIGGAQTFVECTFLGVLHSHWETVSGAGFDQLPVVKWHDHLIALGTI